jgi:hypothetical protein
MLTVAEVVVLVKVLQAESKEEGVAGTQRMELFDLKLCGQLLDCGTQGTA